MLMIFAVRWFYGRVWQMSQNAVKHVQTHHLRWKLCTNQRVCHQCFDHSRWFARSGPSIICIYWGVWYVCHIMCGFLTLGKDSSKLTLPVSFSKALNSKFCLHHTCLPRMQRQALKDVEEKVLMVSEVHGVVEKTGYPTCQPDWNLLGVGQWGKIGEEIYSSRTLFPFSISTDVTGECEQICVNGKCWGPQS